MPGAGLRARGARVVAQPPGGSCRCPTRIAASPPTSSAVAVLTTAMLLATLLPGQTVAADGFAATGSFTSRHQAHLVRCVLPRGPGQHYVVHRRQLFLTGSSLSPGQHALFDLRKEDIAFCARASTSGHLYVGGLNSGTVHVLDEASGARLFSFQGLANTFAVEPLANDRLLVQANPTWPSGGSNSGLWLVEPGVAPRLLLQLVGPSGPIDRLGNGDLVVAELGAIVPPPPGAARLLRFPAAAVQAAIAGGTLTIGQASQIGTGYAGIYDLAVDDADRVYVSDPASGEVRRTAPGGLDAVETWFVAGPNQYVTGLHWLPGDGAPFAPFQPANHASSLHVTCSDYWTVVEQFVVHPQRPAAVLTPAASITSGTQLVVHHAAANGTGLVLIAPGVGTPEAPLAWPGSPALWLGLDPSQVPFVVPFVVDSGGVAVVPLPYAGGLDLAITLQAAIQAPGGAIATTNPISSHLLP